MTQWTKLNINESVKVRLKPSGIEIMRKSHEALRESFPSLPSFSPPMTDAEGYASFQLWYLMETFGGAISLGAEPPFDTVILVGLPS